MPIAKNTNKEISQIGVLPEFAISTKRVPGICKTSATPTENNPSIKAIIDNEPIKINSTPINFANTLKKNIIISAMVSKKFLEEDFMVLLLFFAAPETDLETFFAATETLSATFSKPSFIFFFNVTNVNSFAHHHYFFGSGSCSRN